MAETRHEVVAARVRERMARDRVTGRELCAQIGMKPTTFSRKFNGEIAFTIDEADDVLAALGLTWEEATADVRPLPKGVDAEVKRLRGE